MKVLITGNKGFIGKKMWQLLNQHNIECAGYDLVDSQDIRNKYQLDKFFELNQPTVVIHLAALAGVRQGEEYPGEYISTNITGTQNVIEMCKKHNVDRLIFFSSSSVFGDTVAEGGIKESCEYNPISIYGTTKMSAEYLIKNSGLKYTIIRPFSVYGEDGRRDMVIYKWIDQIKQKKPITVYGEGDSSRGYTYIEDLVKAVYKLLKKPYDGVLNIGGNEKIRLMELCEIFFEFLDKKNIKYEVNTLEMPKSDIKESFANCEKAREHIGYEPKMKFEKIIKDILEKELSQYK